MNSRYDSLSAMGRRGAIETQRLKAEAKAQRAEAAKRDAMIRAEIERAERDRREEEDAMLAQQANYHICPAGDTID